MRDGVGSTVIITIIIVFIVLVSAYLSFNVNYTKAFRMKNKIIDVYNDYNGNCTSKCHKEIKDYADKLGYKPAELVCPTDKGYKAYPTDGQLYCAKMITINSDLSGSSSEYDVQDKRKTKYYNIVTRINIDIPVLGGLGLPLTFMNVSGDTGLF